MFWIIIDKNKKHFCYILSQQIYAFEIQTRSCVDIFNWHVLRIWVVALGETLIDTFWWVVFHAVWLPCWYPRLDQISLTIDWFLLCSMILFMLLVNPTNFHFTKFCHCLRRSEAAYSISIYCVLYCVQPYCITIILCVFLLDLRVVLHLECSWFILCGCECGVCDMIAKYWEYVRTHDRSTHGYCSVFFADVCWLLICQHYSRDIS